MSGQVISAVNLTNGNKHSIGLPYGVCSTAKDTAAKTVTVNGGDGFVLEAGAMVIVKFTNANSIASPTLNVNGTGAKSICRYGTTKASTETTTTGWVAGAVQTFVYDGTNWIREYWNNTTYSNASLGQGYAEQDNTAQAAAITATLGSYSLTAGGVVAFKANYNVLANSTLNINGKGAKPIWFRGLAIANNIIKAGDVATLFYDGANYHLLAVDRWQNDIKDLKDYADNAANAVKNDLLNGAGAAYDTLKELGDLIDDNKDAIDALETVAAGKANATHTHAISDVTNLQSALDGKANASHGTHVSFDSTNKPVMNGTAAFGTSTKVARADHVHPTDTSRASKTEFDTHVADTVKHITATERTNWGAAYTHSQVAHAPSNAQANQNAFSNVKVGTTTIAADTTTDTLELVGENVTITPDATNDKVTISVAAGSTSAAGILKLTDSVSSTSTTTAATPKNVKAAYDLANTAKTNAATAQTAADNAQTTANEAKSAAAANTQSISAHTQSISAHTTRLTNLETKVGDGFEAITTTEIQALFA